MQLRFELSLRNEVGYGTIEVAPCLGKGRAYWREWRRIKLVKTWLDDARIGFGKEKGNTTAARGKYVTVACGLAFNKPLASQAAQVIGHLVAAVVGLGKVCCDEGT